MNLNEYCHLTDETAVYPDKIPVNASPCLVSLLYCAAKLCGEAGEVSEHIGKALRDDAGVFTIERVESLKKEMGDVFWYLARICVHLHIDPYQILEMNIEKLQSRKDRGVIHGSGSDR